MSFNFQAARGVIAALPLCAILTALPTISVAQTESENIALNRPVTFSVRPNYLHSMDPDDHLQLTDGKLSSGGDGRVVEGTQAIWVQKSTVGWNRQSPIVITVDLGKISPVSGVSYSTAAGQAGVTWPTAIFIAVSDDLKQWRIAGDLVALSKPQGAPPASGYSTHRYRINDLQTRGRYVSFIVESQPYAFVDEIEVYRGDDALLQDAPKGQAISNPQEWIVSRQIRDAILRRLQLDITTVRTAISSSELTPARKQEFETRLNSIAGEVNSVPFPEVASFRTTFPQNDVQAKVWALHGALLATRLPGVVAWKQHRYGWLTPTDAPKNVSERKASIDIQMLGSEWRADSFILTNATEKVQKAQLKIVGLPGASRADWLTVSQVPWTDTAKYVAVAAALPVVANADGAYHLELPAGLPSKVWLTVDSSKLPVATHRGEIVTSVTGKELRIPFSVRVSPVKMPRPRLALGMWDYTSGNGHYGITAKNLEASIAQMQSYGVDTPWATSWTLPWPSAGDYDVENQLINPLDFSIFDQWVKRWPKARRYFVFANVQRTFANATMGTPLFEARVGAWAKALSAHMRELGLQPQQLGILLVDEPKNEEQDERIAEWSRIINAVAPELTLFSDPIWHRPDQVKNQAAFTNMDILCPELATYGRGGQPVAEYFEKRRQAGQELWFYQCSGPTRTYSPTRYFRQQSWSVFKLGGTGMGFWSFGDVGGAKSSWNEYLATWNPYAPAFLSETDVTDSIHWQAIREGMQDYETFALLRDAAARTKNASLRSQAKTLLDKLPLAPYPTEFSAGTYADYHWERAEDPQIADDYRLQILALLEKLHKS